MIMIYSLRKWKGIKYNVRKVIAEGDSLEIKTRVARRRLSEVSKHFSKYSEEEVRKVYEDAHNFTYKTNG